MYLMLSVPEAFHAVNLVRLIENHHQRHPESILAVKLALSRLDRL